MCVSVGLEVMEGGGGVHWLVYHGTCVEVRGQLYGVCSVLPPHLEVPGIKLGPLGFCKKQYFIKFWSGFDISWAWWYTSLIPKLRRQMQENFSVSSGQPRLRQHNEIQCCCCYCFETEFPFVALAVLQLTVETQLSSKTPMMPLFPGYWT